MILWIDAQLSPELAPWIHTEFGIEVRALRELALRDSEDSDVYFAARRSGAVILSKDSDFLRLQHRLGPPPAILWLTCGNTSNSALKRILKAALPYALQRIEKGEYLVEIQR